MYACKTNPKQFNILIILEKVKVRTDLYSSEAPGPGFVSVVVLKTC